MSDDKLKAAPLAYQNETFLDSPDGRLTFVDYNRYEVRTNLSQSMGVRPQMSTRSRPDRVAT